MFFGEFQVGMVDRIPRVGYVVTNFHHLNFLPLVPLGSYFVSLGPQDYQVQIPLSVKSVFMAWFRAGCCLGIVVGCIFLAIECNRPVPFRIALVGTLILSSITMLTLSYFRRFRNASHVRAQELAERLGLPIETRLMIDVAYGRKTPVQADLELANRQSSEIVELSDFA